MKTWMIRMSNLMTATPYRGLRRLVNDRSHFARRLPHVFWACVGLLLMLLVGLSALGCADFSPLLPGSSGPPGAGDSGNVNDNDGGEVDPSSLAVRLQASNPTPTLNEEVILTCSLVEGDPFPGDPARRVTYEFAPDTGRLSVDANSGVARFVISDGDLNAAVTFTCRAVVDGSERGQVSNAVVVVAQPAPGDDPLEP